MRTYWVVATLNHKRALFNWFPWKYLHLTLQPLVKWECSSEKEKQQKNLAAAAANEISSPAPLVWSYLYSMWSYIVALDPFILEVWCLWGKNVVFIVVTVTKVEAVDLKYMTGHCVCGHYTRHLFCDVKQDAFYQKTNHTWHLVRESSLAGFKAAVHQLYTSTNVHFH